MNAITHNLIQGSPEWHAHRATHLNASDAARMLAMSGHDTRDNLLKEKASGIVPEISNFTEGLFERGHGYEDIARPWAEELIGEELYPVTMSRDVDDLKLSSSMDGLTLGGDLAWEHKHLNAKLGRLLADGIIPNENKPQLEQILLVTGAERVLFMASAGNRDDMQCAWYVSDPLIRSTLILGWQQFVADLAEWSPPAVEPAPILQPIQQLPSLLVEIEGRVLQTNLDAFRQAAEALISGIKTDLATDADFAEAEQAAKFCNEAEKRLETVKAVALAQTSSIEEVFQVMDGLRESLRSTRLQLEKRVKARKEQIRIELVTEFRALLAKHVRECNRVLGAEWIATPPPTELAEAIKGRKSIASCREVLFAKVSEIKARISTATATLGRNRDALQTPDGDKITLFPDFATMGTRAPEEFDALAELRIRRHRDEEERAAQVKAEREKAEARKAEANRQARIDAMQSQLEANRAAAAAPPPTAPAEPPASDPPEAIEPPTTDAEVSAYVPFSADIDDITAFLKARDFGAEHSHVRSILVEFVRFCDKRGIDALNARLEEI